MNIFSIKNIKNNILTQLLKPDEKIKDEKMKRKLCWKRLGKIVNIFHIFS